eukprot:TRINITY_DN18544_c0_g1_i1.p1 TRINITY_DN18544_c0_g1~~TRINITY_DN18544_c0_g1_i1.p1  ORF type:complete len:658 (+),score=103.08 TRINITY_DN18544_c0_g1_i1:37-2010(+)
MATQKHSSPLPIIHRIEATDGGVISQSVAKSLDGRTVGISQLSPFEARLMGPHTASFTSGDSQNMLWKQSGSLVFKPEEHSDLAEIAQRAESPTKQIVEIEIRKSSFVQTLLNAVNVLLGIGILSLPYAFAKGGYMTMVVLAGISLAAGYTAQLLGIMQRDIILIADALTKTGRPSACNGSYKIVKTEDATRSTWEKLDGSWRLYWEDGRWHVIPLETADSTGETTSLVEEREVGYTSLETNCKYPLREDQTPFTCSDWVQFGQESEYQKITARDSSVYFSFMEGDFSSPIPTDTDITVNTFINQSKNACDNSDPESEAENLFQGPIISTLDQYADIGLASYSDMGCAVLKVLFFLELFLFLVSATIVIKENINQISAFIPDKLMTLLVGVVVWPSAMVRDFSKLSWLSFVGFLSCFVLLSSVVYTAFATSQSDPAGTGSILNPAKTQETFIFKTVSLSFSLIMSSFGGHSLFPVLRSDMQDPSGYGKVVTVSFTVTAVYCCIIGIMGYMMFGEDCKDVIVLNYPGGVVTTITDASIASVCFSKYGITFNALCLDLERTMTRKLGPRKRSWHLFAFRCLMMTGIISLAIIIPHFGVIMSLVGAAVSCSISLIFPLLAYLKLHGSDMNRVWYYANVVFVGIAVYFAITGTINSVGLDL